MQKKKKRWGDRKEAARVRQLDDFTQIVPYLMKKRNGACIYFKETVDAANIIKFIEENNKKYSYFGVFLAALTRTIAERPHLNRFVQGYRHYQRKKIVLSFVAKKAFTEEAVETNVKLTFDRYAALDEVSEKLAGNVAVAKDMSHDDTTDILKWFTRFPRFMLRIMIRFIDWLDFHGWYPKTLYDFDPCMCSAFVTNLGSIGLESVPYHHLYDRGTCSIFIAIGKIHKGIINIEGEGPVEKDVMEFAVTLDERISNGFYFIKAIDLFKYYLMNPEKLKLKPEEVPDDL